MSLACRDRGTSKPKRISGRDSGPSIILPTLTGAGSSWFAPTPARMSSILRSEPSAIVSSRPAGSSLDALPLADSTSSPGELPAASQSVAQLVGILVVGDIPVAAGG